MPIEPNREETLFAAALRLPANERASFLARECAGDAQLRQRVEVLLQADAQAGQFLEEPPAGVAAETVVVPPGPVRMTEQTGERIWRYKLLEKIGEGGFGDVWMAEQEDPVRRRVALKIIKVGMDTREVVARFEAERQALALMDHPNIARVFDGGATESGRPYFVMELVRGVPITTYCDEHRLNLPERLELFVQVCQAVQHAHQKGVIHRDLKPSNILVAIHDDKPVPKVIDFGIAKATQQRLTEKTLFTRFNQFIGTPAYMSPEQAGLSSLDIDTRSDIYSLGVLLYELLTGRTPFSKEELLAAGYEEICRIIREKEPPKPSTRLSTLTAAERSTIAAQRKVPPEKLGRLVRGEMDWVVMKALEKDRARRYESATAFAQDIERFLRHEPVAAVAPSLGYRAAKFARRNRIALATASLLALVLITGAAVSTWQAIRATHYARESRRLATQVKDTFSASDSTLASQLLDKGQTAEAVAYLARALKTSPKNHAATAKLVATLAYYNFPLPLGPPLKHEAVVHFASFAPDGSKIVTGAWDGTIRVWEVATGKSLSGPLTVSGAISLLNPDGTARGPFVAVLSSDGVTLATGSQEGHIRILNLANGTILAPAQQPSRAVNAIAITRDKRHLVAGSSDGIAYVFSLDNQMRVEALLNHDAPVLSLASTPDETKLVTGSDDKTGRIWDLTSGRLLADRLKHDGRILVVRVTPDGRKVVTGSDDKTARVWDITTGNSLTPPMRHDDAVWHVEISPDGTRAITGTGSKNNTVRIWDLQTGEPIGPLLKHDGWIWQVAISTDGTKVATASENQLVRVWDLASGKLLAVPRRHAGGVAAVAFSPDGTKVASASGDKTAQVWELAYGGALGPPLPRTSWQFAMNPDGRRLVASLESRSEELPSSAQVWDVGSGEAEGEPIKLGASLGNHVISPDGSKVASSGWDDRVRLWDLVTGRINATVDGEFSRFKMPQFGPDGKKVITATYNAIHIWDTVTGRELMSPFQHPKRVNSMLSSPDGSKIYSASEDGITRVWEAETGRLLEAGFPFPVMGSFAPGMFTPDGTRLVVPTNISETVVCDLAKRRVIAHMRGHRWSIDCMTICRDGKKLVTGTGDQTARMWDLATGAALIPDLQHQAGVSALAFSLDSKRVATGSADAKARVWDAATGEPLTPSLEGGAEVAFNADGSKLVTSWFASGVRIWDLPPTNLEASPDLIELAEALAGLRLNEKGLLEMVDPQTLFSVRDRIRGLNEAGPLATWSKWIVANRTSRPISPLSQMSLAKYVDLRLDQNAEETLREALLLANSNAKAHARLARLLVSDTAKGEAHQIGEADFHSQRAIALAPSEAETWWARAVVLECKGELSQALSAIDRAIERTPTNAELWSVKGRLHDKASSAEAAERALSRAIELAKPEPEFEKVLNAALLNRAQVLQRLGQLSEAAADNCRARGIPIRDPMTDPNLIDLSLLYNEGWFDERLSGTNLRTGVSVLDGTRFDLRGILRVNTLIDSPWVRFPEAVTGIRVGIACRRLHFLHAAAVKAEEGAPVGSYVVLYSDGLRQEIPLVYGRELRSQQSWGAQPQHLAPSPEPTTQTTIAWTHVSERQITNRLFKTTWINVRPEVRVESLDLVCGKRVGLVLIGITAE